MSSRARYPLLFALIAASCTASGCSLAPKGFKGIKKPEPLVRARAIPLGRNLPEQKVIPELLDSLNDRDAVVRLAASEELKSRSGQDFGFVPYAEEEERAPAASRWRAWWAERQSKLASFRPKRRRKNTAPGPG